MTCSSSSTGNRKGHRSGNYLRFGMQLQAEATITNCRSFPSGWEEPFSKKSSVEMLQQPSIRKCCNREQTSAPSWKKTKSTLFPFLVIAPGCWITISTRSEHQHFRWQGNVISSSMLLLPWWLVCVTDDYVKPAAASRTPSTQYRKRLPPSTGGTIVRE